MGLTHPTPLANKPPSSTPAGDNSQFCCVCGTQLLNSRILHIADNSSFCHTQLGEHVNRQSHANQVAQKEMSVGVVRRGLGIPEYCNCLHQVPPDGQQRFACHCIQVNPSNACHHHIAFTLKQISPLKVLEPVKLTLERYA